MICCCSLHTSRLWWIIHSTQCHRRGCNNIPSFLQRTAPIARSLCEGWTRHDLHILVTAPFCCDWKSPSGMCAKFRNVATIEIMCYDRSSRTLVITFNRSHVSIGRASMLQSLYYCLFAYIYCCSSSTSRSWWITQSMQCQRRGCNNIIWFKSSTKKLSFDLNQWSNQWFKSSKKKNQAKNHNAVLKLCVISMTQLFSILIDFHLY